MSFISIETVEVLDEIKQGSWSWSSNTLDTWFKEPTHWKRPWCWERLKAGGEGDVRGWDGWMASPTQRTWVWANSERWWRMGKPGVLQSMGSQSRTRLSDWTTRERVRVRIRTKFPGLTLRLHGPSHRHYTFNLVAAALLPQPGCKPLHSHLKLPYLCCCFSWNAFPPPPLKASLPGSLHDHFHPCGLSCFWALDQTVLFRSVLW